MMDKVNKRIQVGKLLALSDLQYKRNLVALGAQKQVLERMQSEFARCDHELFMMQQKLHSSRDRLLNSGNLTANEFYIRSYADAERSSAVNRCVEKLAQHKQRLADESSELQCLQARLFKSKHRNDALNKKLGTRIAEAERQQQTRVAESAEDDFALREYTK